LVYVVAACKDLMTFQEEYVEKDPRGVRQTGEWWELQTILGIVGTAHVATVGRTATVAGTQLKMGDVMH
jgi:hypothetical protein